MKKIFILFTFLPLNIYSQSQSPSCIDPKSTTCSESTCTTHSEKLCWLDDYVMKSFPNSSANVESYRIFDGASEAISISQSNSPWGAYYFPYKNGGISQRWQSSTPKKHIVENDTTLNINKIKTLPTIELNKLSPALKMDLFLGDPMFKLTKMELKRRSPNRAIELKKQGHEVSENNGGFCNGARAAGVLWKEPTSNISIISPIKGVKPFVFTPTDIKAILSASFFHPQHANNFGDNALYVGKDKPSNENCGIDPATFDILLRLMLKGLKFPFYIDADRSSNIDNKTVLKYDRTINNLTSIGNNQQLATITVTLMTLAEFGPTKSNKETKPEIYKAISSTILKNIKLQDINNPHKEEFQFFRYKYNLLVDTDKKIISGDWIIEDGFTKPNFAWVAWGEGNDNCSFFDNLDSSGNPYLSIIDIKKLLNSK